MEQNKRADNVIDRTGDTAADITKGFSYLLVCVACLLLAMIFSFSLIGKTDEVHVLQLQSRININEAEAASLVRLPQIGITRAEKIIAYRQTNADGEPVFTCPQDLQKVKGIGPVIAGGLADHVRFE